MKNCCGNPDHLSVQVLSLVHCSRMKNCCGPVDTSMNDDLLHFPLEKQVLIEVCPLDLSSWLPRWRSRPGHGTGRMVLTSSTTSTAATSKSTKYEHYKQGHSQEANSCFQCRKHSVPLIVFFFFVLFVVIFLLILFLSLLSHRTCVDQSQSRKA